MDSATVADVKVRTLVPHGLWSVAVVVIALARLSTGFFGHEWFEHRWRPPIGHYLYSVGPVDLPQWVADAGQVLIPLLSTLSLLVAVVALVTRRFEAIIAVAV